MKYEITGTTMQVVSIDLEAGEQIYSQTNTMAWMSDAIQMDTHTGGGIFQGIKRTLGGGSFFVTDFTAQRPGKIAFAPRFPGTILPFQLAAGESIVCRKETFLCAEKSITFEIAFQQKLGASLFGGEGFVLQKVTGPGVVWLDLSGEVVVEDLQAGQTLYVHAGHVGAQTPSITFDIKMMSGVKNILFGGEGLFLASVTGPGRVWLQSMPIMNLAEEIARFLPQPQASESSISPSVGNVAGGVLGGLLGGLLGGSRSDDT